MRLRYTRAALRQIEAVLTYTAEHSPQGALRIRARIMAAAALIEGHPQTGQATDQPGIRRVVLIPFPYVLFYRVIGPDVIVTRLRHVVRGS